MIHQPFGADDAFSKAGPGNVFSVENVGKVRDPWARISHGNYKDLGFAGPDRKLNRPIRRIAKRVARQL